MGISRFFVHRFVSLGREAKYCESRIFRRYGVGKEEEWCSIHQNCMSVAISTLPPAQHRVPRLRTSKARSYVPVRSSTRCVLYIYLCQLVLSIPLVFFGTTFVNFLLLFKIIIDLHWRDDKVSKNIVTLKAKK